jgi:hypothetical protein
MSTGVRSLYHIAINGKGFMLRGAPSQPRYIKETAPALSNQLGTGDLSYASLAGSGWSYWTQTDWSGGFHKLKWEDKATFQDGQAVEVLKKFGKITLQNGFTSAVSISGSHKYGSHAVHDGQLLLGSVKAGTAKIFKITSAGTLSTLSAYTGISAVNTMSRFKNDTIIGLTRTSGTLKTYVRYNGSVVSAFRNANPIVRAVKGIGIRAYSGELVTSLSGDVLYYSTDLSTFTSAYQAGKNRKISKIEDLFGSPYFFVEEARKVEMYRWDEFSERAYLIYTWEDLTNWGVSRYLSLIVISGTSNNLSVAFAFNGARLWQIFDDQLNDASYDFSKPFVFNGNLQTKGAQWDGVAWVPGLYGKFATVQYTPFANFANRAYAFAITGTLLKIAYTDTTKYAISGHIISSEFGSHIGGVDKLVNAVNINMDALATGQTIEVYRSVDGGATFTSIGTANFSTDGAIKKKNFPIASGFVTKLWNYKVQLVGPGTSTPTFHDITWEYRPIPDLKKRWSLSIDAGDEVMLLNKQREQRDGKSLISDLWLEKEAKRTVVYEDVDAFSVNFVSAMTSANTSARVNNTQYMPRKGRMRVLKSGVVEEMTYTSAETGVIKGITRAQKGTVARAYTSADVIDNNYNVFIVDMREQVNNTDQNKTESVAQITLLEV